jgi:ribosomal protein S18 acetylase RimI-like enzyme
MSVHYDLVLRKLQLTSPDGRMATMNTSIPNSKILVPVIRPAGLDDLNLCLALDPSYSTESVWQMDVQSEDGRRAMTFRTVRLPRSMHVTYPRGRDQFVASWKRCDGFLVALQPETPTDNPMQSMGIPMQSIGIIGYVALTAHAAEGAVWISDLVVEREHRRHGVGTALLNAALEWAKSRSLRQVLVEVQTKNYPAICMCEKLGFAFCGFNDRYYANQDIAVFFARNLR